MKHEAIFGSLNIGDRVEVNRLGYIGTGTISEISDKIERGGGTKNFKAFYILFDQGGEGWFSGDSLTRLRR